ncbi:MAG: hypothetical protein ACRDGT_14020 [Candidatus Limnocylindria bacterium]
MPDPLQSLIDRVGRGETGPVYLVRGETVLAEPAAKRLAEAIAGRSGGSVEVRHRPPRLSPLLGDLRTYSLFGGGRVLVVVESAALADAGAVAALIDEVAEVLPIDAAAGLDGAARQAAGRLLQALRLHRIDPAAGDPEQVIRQLPDPALQGAKRPGGRARRRGSRQITDLREQLAGLLAAAREDEIQGWDDSELAELGRVLERGLPEGHALVLAERDVAGDHPLVTALEERGTSVAVGEVAAGRRGSWDGLEALAAELARETGTRLDGAATRELARRTLRTSGGSGGGYGGDPRASADSASRFAAEYRKLATLTGGEVVDRETVERVVTDRGEEDVWQILDSLGGGRMEEALERSERALRGADDPLAARLSFFGLLAGTCRNLTAVAGLLDLTGVPGGEANYGRFKARIAPRLQADLPGGLPNPIAGLHPYRLHRAYLAASRLGSERARLLPWRVLETERRLKGDSDLPEAAMVALMAAVGS